jgi:5'-nucleotidase
MKLLLTNDDGIDAPGLQALLAAARQLGEVVLVAPAQPQSGCGHRVTTDRAFRVTRRSEDCYVVEGTPADCVRVVVEAVAPDVDWVLSGVNCGGNLGADVYHSGTVAAVREAALHGKPGVALSHYRRRGLDLDWARASAWALPVLRDLLGRPLPSGGFWNVNLPHLDAGAAQPEAVVCPLDLGPLPLRFHRAGEWFAYNGDYHQRSRTPGGDVDVCFGGRIAVTRLGLGP